MRFRPRMFLNVLDQIREDWDVNGRDWTLPGFRALAVHRFGAWLGAAAGNRNPIWWVPRWLHRVMFRYVRNHYAIDLPPDATVGRRVVLAHPAGIVIHGCTVIGDGCVIRQNATLGALNGEGGRGLEAPQLGRNVHVGCGAAILGRVTIGDGARIGPNAVVMSDVPAGATVFVHTPRMMLNMRRAASNDPGHDSPIAVGS
jgi:serine O-acetyltransferase